MRAWGARIRLMGRLVFALVATAWLLPCHARWEITELSSVRDASGRMTLEDVQAQPAALLNPLQIRLLDRSVVWVRIQLEPRIDPGLPAPDVRLAAPDSSPVLRIVGLFMTEARLYDSRGPEAGGTAPLDLPVARHGVHQTLNVPLERGMAPRTLWLRLQPTGPQLLSFAALTSVQLNTVETQAQALHGLVIGFLSAFFLLAAAGLVIERSPLIVSWAAKQSANLAVALLNVNWQVDGQPLNETLFPAQINLEWLRLINPLCTTWFFVNVLLLFSRSTWALRLNQVLMAATIGNLLIFFFVDLALARSLTVVLYAMGGAVTELTGIACVLDSATGTLPAQRTRSWIRALGAAVLFGVAWLCSFPAGLYRVVSIGPYLFVLFMLVSSTAFLIMVVWKRRNHAVEQQAEERLQKGLAAKALQFERDERIRQQEFMVMLTHELKAPLSTIGMVLQSSSASTNMRHHADLALGTMRRVIDHCAKSIKLEEADPALSNQRCSLAVQWQLRLDALQQVERERFELDLEPMLPDIQADLDALTVVLSNLMDNALKYSLKGSPIRVELRSHVNGTRRFQTLCVINQPRPGPLPQPDMLFSKYYRGENQLPVGGSGLGLYLSRAMARRMHGDLSCEINAHQIRFTLHMPQ